jgi:integrase
MLRIRASGFVLGDNPVFPAPHGGLRDPSNTQADLREAFTTAGFEWVTSHVLRKTVATLMDQAGLSARAAADHFGHSKPSMTTDVYFGRGIMDTGAAAVLESLA